MRSLSVVLVALALAGAASASEFRPVQSREQFVDLIAGKALTRFLVRLDVTPDGRIGGNAFGSKVTGDWTWQGSFFCRNLRFGTEDLGPNCQQVLVREDTLRFIADEGKGDQADLMLR